jgi:hypothetical protein
MRAKPTWLRNIFSLNHWRKRANAHKVFNSVHPVNYNAMKKNIISSGRALQTRGHSKDLLQHVEDLRHEFSGQSELIWHHAQLIVLLRRGYKIEDTFKNFNRLWETEKLWLCENLDIRWLISACDTFADHSHDEKERALAFSVSLMLNTLKLYETERYLTNSTEIPYDSVKISYLQNFLVPIFEGMSCFTIGTDDTLRNLVWRMKDVSRGTVAGEILLEVFSRLHQCNSVFARFKAQHRRKNTEWW